MMLARLLRPALFTLLGLLTGLVGCDGGYKTKGGRWHYDDIEVGPRDAASFKPIDKFFARDAHIGYYRGASIVGSHGPSFQVLSEHEARDRHAVYYADTYRKGQEYWSIQHLRIDVVRGADPASYRVLGSGYASDDQQAYFEGVPFPVLDVASFAPLHGGFAHDRQRGYYDRVPIPGSDGASFEMLDERDGQHARDRKQVYHGHVEINTPNRGPHPVVRVLHGAQRDSFRVLGRRYASDGRRVWYQGRVLEDADVASFAVIEEVGHGGDARDSRGLWERGERVEPTPRP